MPNDVPVRLRFGPYEVDLHTHELWKFGVRLRLVGQPFEILAILLARPGEMVTREELRSHLWPQETFGDFNHGLNAAVNKLREALSDSADDPRYIETLPRRGYRFIAKVERAANAESENSQPEESLARPETELVRYVEVSSGLATPAPVVVPASVSEPATSSEIAAPKTETKIVPAPRPRWRRILALSAIPVALSLLWFFSLAHFADWFNAFSSENREASFREATPPVPLVPLTNLADPTSDAAFSPDGTRVGFVRQGYAPGTSGIFVKPLGSLQLLQLTNDPHDCCPVWSPNGRSIAFWRTSGKERVIYEIPSGGGALRKLFADASSGRGYIDWSPDGDSIAFSSRSASGTEQAEESIFLLSLKDLSIRRFSQPPLLNKDWGPAFSPDGQTIAFIRRTETGLPEMIVTMPAAGGEIRVLHAQNNGLVGPPAWTADNQSILFSSGPPALFRVPASGGDPSDLTGAIPPAWHPAVSRMGYRLAYQQISATTSLWQIDLGGPRTKTSAPPQGHGVVVTDTGRNEGVQVSPDGKKLAFMSNRSGTTEIWMSDRNGANAIQLTAIGNAGTPRWSPDGRSIVFDRDTNDNSGIFVVNTDGSSVRHLVQGNSGNLVPNWSRDGKWIYFASNRSGTWQVWKIPAAGGDPIQVTAHGGFAAYESSNGRVLYYSKLNMPNPEIWSVPIEGGLETRVSTLVRPDDWANWALVDRGIYFVESDNGSDPALMFYDFASSQVKSIAPFDKMPFWLAATPDGKSVLYEHLDQENSHVMLLSNFR